MAVKIGSISLHLGFQWQMSRFSSGFPSLKTVMSFLVVMSQHPVARVGYSRCNVKASSQTWIFRCFFFSDHGINITMKHHHVFKGHFVQAPSCKSKRTSSANLNLKNHPRKFSRWIPSWESKGAHPPKNHPKIRPWIRGLLFATIIP